MLLLVELTRTLTLIQFVHLLFEFGPFTVSSTTWFSKQRQDATAVLLNVSSEKPY